MTSSEKNSQAKSITISSAVRGVMTVGGSEKNSLLLIVSEKIKGEDKAFLRKKLA
jgi:hypothetical protein